MENHSSRQNVEQEDIPHSTLSLEGKYLQVTLSRAAYKARSPQRSRPYRLQVSIKYEAAQSLLANGF